MPTAANVQVLPDGTVAAGALGHDEAAGGALALPGSTAQQSSTPLLAASEVDPNIEQVKQFVANDPKISAQVVKGWVGE